MTLFLWETSYWLVAPAALTAAYLLGRFRTRPSQQMVTDQNIS